jgi:hypothetical protein
MRSCFAKRIVKTARSIERATRGAEEKNGFTNEVEPYQTGP